MFIASQLDRYYFEHFFTRLVGPPEALFLFSHGKGIWFKYTSLQVGFGLSQPKCLKTHPGVNVSFDILLRLANSGYQAAEIFRG